jgi:dihydroneopterin aldolase
MDKISIHELSVETIIGIHPQERRQKQGIHIDLDLFVDTANAAKTDVIEDTLSYGDVARLVVELAENSQFNLIEALAGAIADAVLAAFHAERLIVTVSKPAAVANARNVSVTIERSRK